MTLYGLRGLSQIAQGLDHYSLLFNRVEEPEICPSDKDSPERASISRTHVGQLPKKPYRMINGADQLFACSRLQFLKS